MRKDLIITPITGKELEKTKQDVNFLCRLQEFCQQYHCRLILSGGYGLDAVLGKITRPHNDVDVIIYGQLSRKKALSKITKFIKQLFPQAKISTHENDFMVGIDINSSGFGANLYFVETANSPYEDLNTLIIKSGQTHKNNPRQFPAPVKGKLLGAQFEAQDPSFHLADIISKHKQGPQLKHEQDIQNLQKLLT